MQNNKRYFRQMDTISNMTNNKTEGKEADPHADCRMEEACANENGVSRTECFMDLFQKKYRCFILYAVILISVIEFFYLIFNSENVSREDYLNIISRFLNRTGSIKM